MEQMTGKEIRKKSLAWWVSLTDEERRRLALKHFFSDVTFAGLDYVLRSSIKIENIWRNEVGIKTETK